MLLASIRSPRKMCKTNGSFFRMGQAKGGVLTIELYSCTWSTLCVLSHSEVFQGPIQQFSILLNGLLRNIQHLVLFSFSHMKQLSWID